MSRKQQFVLKKAISATSKSQRKDKNVVITHNPNRSHSSHCADDGRNGAEFTSLKNKMKQYNNSH